MSVNGDSKPSTGPRVCGCKGIRSCRLCQENQSLGTGHEDQNRFRVYEYCGHCRRAWLTVCNDLPGMVNDGNPMEDGKDEKLSHQDHSNVFPENFKQMVASQKKQNEQVKITSQCSHRTDSVKDFPGIEIISDFISEEEEVFLDTSIAKMQFCLSQSGRRKQDFGPKVNFKKRKLRCTNFKGLPLYSQCLYKRMKGLSSLKDFEPVELCNLEYCQDRGSHIEPHYDDTWIWGERLVTLNLLSDSVLTFTYDSEADIRVRVPLFRRSLLVVSAAARHDWKHEILPTDVGERRVAMTFRELSEEFMVSGKNEEIGQELLAIALSFRGDEVAS